MQGCTAERVSALAPDAASLKAGQGLAVARKWASVGVDGTWCWGECQGSGAKPYQVRIDWAEPAFKCSCPSRKFPCKHAIGLLLLEAAGNVPGASPPAWVVDWMAERGARAEKKREKSDAPAKPVDAAAQQKRKAARLDRVADGLAALKLWLHDWVRTGVAAAPSRGYGYFDTQARRLIDAQAPGVARRVQALAGVAAGGAGWQRPFLQGLADLHTLVRAFEGRAALPPQTQDLLLNVIGLPRAQEDVLATPSIADHWQIVARTVTQEDRLRVQHTWLLGRRSGACVAVLGFAHGAQPLDASLAAGHGFDGEVVCYPGDRLRGLIKSRGDLVPLTMLGPRVDIDALLDRYANERADNPWLEGCVAALGGATPGRGESAWQLADAAGRQLRLTCDDTVGWTLAALSGGHPIDVVTGFDGVHARPLAAVVDGAYVRLTPSEAEQAA